MNKTDLVNSINQQQLFKLLIAPADVSWLSFETALQSNWIPDMMATFALSYSGLDQRGQGAFFISKLSYLLASMLAYFDLQSGKIPTVTTKTLWIKPQTEPDTLLLESLTLNEATDGNLRATIIAFFEPFITPVYHYSKLSAAAQWRLIADAIAAAWLLVGRELNCEVMAKEKAMAILQQEKSPLTNRQTHYADVNIWHPESKRQTINVTKTYRLRGGCCRAYTADAHQHCATCVLLTKDQQQQRLKRLLTNELTQTYA